MSKGRIEVITGGMFCHRRGQLVLMSDGSVKAVDEVQVGDHLISPEGAPIRVQVLHRGTGPMAEVQPCRGGDPFAVTLDHYLTLKDTPSVPDGKPSERGGRVVDVSVREWLGWSAKRKGLFKLFRVGVPAFTAPELPPEALDPYFLGVLLGDGSFDTRIGVTTADPEIIQEVEQQALQYDLRVVYDAPKSRAQTVRLVGSRGKANPLADKLRALGLYGLTGADKFIPSQYLTASWRDRAALLAGLIDTDGSGSNGAGFDFINKSKHLADGVAFLARSLGLVAHSRVCTKKAQTGPARQYYRVYIGGDVSWVPTRLPRKQLTRVVKHRPTMTAFRVCVLPDEEPYFGFTVEGGRYLLGDFTVTHNSGKSEELVRRLRRAIIAKKVVRAIKHASDDRYHQTHIGSHAGLTFEAVPLSTVAEMGFVVRGIQVLGIDEAQFFQPGLVEFCEEMANLGMRVIVAGLDQDSNGKPFGPIPHLMSIAEEVTKLHAVCVVCGEEASRSYHKGQKEHQVEVGASQYEARCRGCWGHGSPPKG